ncbi:MAG: hypothetical protein M3R41_00975 [Pseudomonadota bacterium]|nr:hypothetical protein [Pseudomonadota bacterium]
MGWVGIYVTQNWLAWRGDIVRHMRLCKVAAGYVVWMLVVGIGANTMAAVDHRIPSFFDPHVFPVMDGMTVLTFAGLTLAGVAMRGATAWHRRLMLCGAVMVMTPGSARILPLPLFGGWLLWAVWAATVPFILAAVIYDVKTRGTVHPAYAWGFGTITLAFAMMRPIAYSAPVMALTTYMLG